MMHNPPHPGELLRLELLDEMGLSITAAAKKLGMWMRIASSVAPRVFL